MLNSPAERPDKLPWQTLREELQLHAAGDNPDGSPTWHIADPVRNQFFRIGWLEFEILKHWSLGDPLAIAEAIEASTTMSPAVEDILQFAAFLRQQSLLSGNPYPARPSASPWRWLLSNYLFMRIPLVRPGRFLSWLAPRLNFLYSPWFVALTVAVACTGILLSLRQWDTVAGNLARTFTWQGTLGYLAALAASKLLHELAHAVTATRHGVRVGHMGIALVVMWPMAYTDTGESWKLGSSRHRLAIASAGVIAELTLAAWCTLAWVFAPDGAARDALFFLATTAWVWTLAINASPFMRFDGYFIVSDWLDFPGLHERAGALASCWLHRHLLGIDDAEPEMLPQRLRLSLITFALITRVYRLVVFFGIAILVYHAFFKLLGIILFLVEVWVFIARPLWVELHLWWARRDEISRSAIRAWRTLGFAIVLIALIPWPTRVVATGLLRAGHEQALYAPFAAQLLALNVTEGQSVAAGHVAAALFSPRQALERSKAAALAEGYARSASGALALDSDGAAKQKLADQQRVRWVAEVSARDAELARLNLVTEHSGVLRDVDPTLAAGTWVSATSPIAWVITPGRWQVEALVAERDLNRIRIGGSATVVVEGRTQILDGHIVAIDTARSERLTHSLMAASHGGSIAVVSAANGALHPVDAVYRVLIEGTGDEDRVALRRVKVHLAANSESFALNGLSWMISTLIQQGGF